MYKIIIKNADVCIFYSEVHSIYYSSGASRGAKEIYVAMYDFAAETGEEMSVRKGEEMEPCKNFG